ncbi:50S ribosomal protein L22 [Candidatus Methylacidiphilum fumarolicum]|uniref:Large ribosomal subunit protein uL22 n=2 Tax=Candidatus Methylacidiphilum fumarolicum TaxID=591154 RepID=I0K0D7_METFB|nr:50S ribosomal protein L22 [Candidatus Methylacidiphilum fumarolicum]CCG92956.1 50S ribosomal protein L22 [Methylacidiphilum fumariolicum SolV]MBW6414541.1 50S ribosomal protein L22 [Candidatus Methylacidiphilum fumarolicum]TFE65586.1 50S ribosomal protein L22 [Candidatus Methylacidiphilum fumarolicum]TFE73688.1 50S ribosomal protein L22 [Candidatus Methylacidiphilum fumarolicum]TFE75381.1 50S ribosomal protein L22 [Candidatus Methylacidiphilum fumarolicum]
MEVRAVYKMARISAFKSRDVARSIKGMDAKEAFNLLAFYPKKAARIIRKTLGSAIANAENNHNMRVQDLYVKGVFVDEGPTFRRYQPKARGSAGIIRKRTSHIKVILEEKEK